MSTMEICNVCGQQQAAGKRFCGHCGSPMPGLGTGRLKPNALLQSRYVIVRKVGQGGMGAVYLATDQRIQGRVWAVKEMSASLLADPTVRAEAVQGFQQEASILARLRHENLPATTDFFEEGGQYYLVMDFFQGETLAKVLEKQGRRSFAEGQVRGWAEQLCNVLEYLHSQNPPVIFRDLKPGNIILTPEGVLKLIDFGIARHFKPGKARDTQCFGTQGYAPPEQYGKEQTDARSDIYSLGVTLHELLTGHDPATTPFNLPAPRQLNPSISPSMEQAVQKATQLRPTDRFQTVAEMRQALVPARLEVTPPALDLGRVATRQVAGSSFQIANKSGSRLSGTIQSQQAWLQASPTAFYSSPTTVQVHADTAGLRAGQQHRGSLEISSSAGSYSIPVSVTIDAPARRTSLVLLAVLLFLLPVIYVLGKALIPRTTSTPTPPPPTVIAVAATNTPTRAAGASPGGVGSPAASSTPTPTEAATETPVPTRTPTKKPTATATKVPTKRPTATRTPAPRPTTDPHFRADRSTVAKNECTVLRWDMDGIKAVYLDGQGQAGHGFKSVCPSSTQTYTLRVTEQDGRQVEHRLTITVSGVAEIPTFVVEYKGCKGGTAQNVGVVKGQVLDRSGKVIPGAVVAITVDGSSILGPSTSDGDGWYGWNCSPNQKVRFISLTVGGKAVQMSPTNYEIVTKAGCFQHVNLKQR